MLYACICHFSIYRTVVTRDRIRTEHFWPQIVNLRQIAVLKKNIKSFCASKKPKPVNHKTSKIVVLTQIFLFRSNIQHPKKCKLCFTFSFKTHKYPQNSSISSWIRFYDPQIVNSFGQPFPRSAMKRLRSLVRLYFVFYFFCQQKYTSFNYFVMVVFQMAILCNNSLQLIFFRLCILSLLFYKSGNFKLQTEISINFNQLLQRLFLQMTNSQKLTLLKRALILTFVIVVVAHIKCTKCYYNWFIARDCFEKFAASVKLELENNLYF
eukprot:TRINITY_DN29381_c1_g1_i2.p1 TRINITY_DN29381_c1_g1~~TRINITY_DN29381_c1_g1_i2.p1  ORF type:complete len:266 (-),score=-22.78 TRINITY_DN29381_c1_g1_i2:85-882(-)